MKRFLGNAALVLFGVCFAVLATEVAVNFFQPKQFEIRHIYALLNGAVFDSRSKKEVVQDLRSIGNERVVPQVSGFSFDKSETDKKVLALSGVSNAKTVFCNESGEWVVYHSDRYGFNNDDQVWDERSAGVIVGDSFAHGACVSRNDTVSSRLSSLSQTEFLNLGVNGAGPYRVLGTIKEYAELVRPKVVVWLFFEGNDIINVSKERGYSVLEQYPHPGVRQNLSDHQERIDRWLLDKVDWALAKSTSAPNRRQEGWQWVKYRLVLESLRRYIGVPFLLKGLVNDSPTPDSDPQHKHDDRLEIFQKILLESKRVVSQWGGRLIFVYLPQYERFVSGTVNAQPEIVLTMVEKIGIPTIDMSTKFLEKNMTVPELFPFGLEGHYTSRGYLEVAENINKKLKSLGIQ